MKIKLNDQEKARLISVEDAYAYMAKMANSYTQALRGLIVRRDAEISSILKDHGVLEGKMQKMDLEKGELEVSNIKIPSRNEIAKMKSAGFITDEQAKKARGVKK